MGIPIESQEKKARYDIMGGYLGTLAMVLMFVVKLMTNQPEINIEHSHIELEKKTAVLVSQVKAIQKDVAYLVRQVK